MCLELTVYVGAGNALRKRTHGFDLFSNRNWSKRFIVPEIIYKVNETTKEVFSCCQFSDWFCPQSFDGKINLKGQIWRCIRNGMSVNLPKVDGRIPQRWALG